MIVGFKLIMMIKNQKEIIIIKIIEITIEIMIEIMIEIIIEIIKREIIIE